ncbi:MAG: TetR/AcrR family transcriptional regulator [Clostridia bacterium]|nr:TetR/AcrR family transcriptional regulator [Clostridia bacterium]
MPTREEQKEQRRKTIIIVALELFISRGYAATRITDIAEAADMSMGLLFHYFPSKEKLYEELIQIGITGPQSVMQTEYPMDNPLEFFYQAAQGIMNALKEPAVGKFFVLMKQACMDVSLSDEIKKLLEKMTIIEDSVPIIEAGQRIGTIREGSAITLSRVFWGSIQGVAEYSAAYPDMELPDSRIFGDILAKR